MEALEKIVEKVNRIDQHSSGKGTGLDALIQDLVRMKPENGDDWLRFPRAES